jgi:hypothetical protein
MIDLRGDLKEGDRLELITAVREFGIRQLAIYNSGRSYHIYAYALLSTRRWTQFMGRCLLLNRPDRSELVDARWVGHRLLAGYGALRWTHGNVWYLSEPVYESGFDVPRRLGEAGGVQGRQAVPDVVSSDCGQDLPRVEHVQPWLFP